VRFRLAPAEADRLLLLLIAKPAGVASPVAPAERQSNKVHICRLRAKLRGVAQIQSGYRIGAGTYFISDEDRARLLAIAAHLPDPSTGPPGAKLTGYEAAIHAALLAAGDGFTSAADIAVVLAAKLGRRVQRGTIGVHLFNLRRKLAAARIPLDIQCGRNVGWRYNPVSLAIFLNASPPAPAPHLAPIKKGMAR
jgi:hypothetical protein